MKQSAIAAMTATVVAAACVPGQATAQSAPVPEAAEIGTPNRLAKYLTSTTLGNAVLTEYTGRIGLGTGLPQALFHINNSLVYPRKRSALTISSRHFDTDLGNTLTGLSFRDHGGTTYGFSGIWQLGGKLQFQAKRGVLSSGLDVFTHGAIGPATAQMTIDGATGQVLIGTTSPGTTSARLTVSGASYAIEGVGGFVGVRGTAATITGIGVSGLVPPGGGGYAGYFNGRVYVAGTLGKAAGAFKIDHPQDPANKFLSHSFVESPDMMNVYNGNIVLDGEGRANVELPGYFGSLNKDFRYQLTALDAPGPNLHVARRIANGRFTIAGGSPGQEVSWQVTGIRQDAYANAHRIPVEEEKGVHERGRYLHPELFGASPSQVIDDRVAVEQARADARAAAAANHGRANPQQAAMAR